MGRGRQRQPQAQGNEMCDAFHAVFLPIMTGGTLIGRPPRRRNDKAMDGRCEASATVGAMICRRRGDERRPPAWGRLHTKACGLAIGCARRVYSAGRAREMVMAKGQMRSNKEKKKPKADKNLKKGGAAPVNPFATGKTPAGQSPNSKKN